MNNTDIIKEFTGELHTDNGGSVSPVTKAACSLAEELHRGQVDKGGKDYFLSHLMVVGKKGRNWKEITVGLLHDAAEDTPHSVEEVIAMLRARVVELLPASGGAEPSEEEWGEIAEALHCLNHHSAPTREEYIEHLANNSLARRVKMHDLESNMDLSRIPNPTDKDFARLEKYKKEYSFLAMQ